MPLAHELASFVAPIGNRQATPPHRNPPPLSPDSEPRAASLSPELGQFGHSGLTPPAPAPVQTNNQTRLTWSCGSGHYQLLRTTDLASGVWENVANPTTETTATVAATNGFEFFRVQSLP